MAENTVPLEAVMEQNVIYVVLFIQKEKKNLYVKNPNKFIYNNQISFFNHENSNYWCIWENRL